MQSAFLSPQLAESIANKICLQKDRPGLYVVATPIGNIFDISLRALYILKKSKVIFAEDTRNSKKLLNFYEIDIPLVSCHEYNETDLSVVNKIKQGEIFSLISDAGTPGISDPGYRLVNWCIENNIAVFPIPGACSFVTGLSASGLPTDKFTFFGFLPYKRHARRELLQNISDKSETLIFLESPKRLSESLKEMLDVFGDRHCCICKEITKLYESFHRGKLSEIVQYFSDNEPLGEFVIIVSGNDKENFLDKNEIFQELSELLKANSVRDAVAIISEKYKFNKKDVYQKALELKNELDGI